MLHHSRPPWLGRRQDLEVGLLGGEGQLDDVRQLLKCRLGLDVQVGKVVPSASTCSLLSSATEQNRAKGQVGIRQAAAQPKQLAQQALPVLKQARKRRKDDILGRGTDGGQGEEQAVKRTRTNREGDCSHAFWEV